MKRVLLVALVLAATAQTSAATVVSAQSVKTIESLELREGTYAEKLRFREDWIETMLSMPIGGAVEVTDFPAAPGQYQSVTLERFDVYAPDARIFAPDAKGAMREVPRSKLRFFKGTFPANAAAAVAMSIDPSSRQIEAFIQLEGTYEIRAHGTGSHVIAAIDAANDLKGGFSCGVDGHASFHSAAMAETLKRNPALPAAISSLHQITLAFDTDNEFMNIKFADNTTNATNYIAQLLANMTVIYERDLLVRLLQGTTFLRTSNVADPYLVQPSAPFYVAGAGQLDELKSVWGSNHAGVTRGLVVMLSGKQLEPQTGDPEEGKFYASGYASIAQLCSNDHGFSFNQVFKFAANTATNDTRIVAHEIGHNFGANHTDCDGLDQCSSGCYGGPFSCPTPATHQGVTNVRGTLMSYCHLYQNCSATEVFHNIQVTGSNSFPAIVSLQSRVQTQVGACITPVPVVNGVSPNSGSTLGGTSVTITGNGFVNGATVQFDATNATGVSVLNATTITATTPAHATGTVSVSVTNPSSSPVTRNNAYFYSPPPTAAAFNTVAPCRILDTRSTTPLGPSAQRTINVTGTCGIPASAKSIAANITVVTPSASGFLGFFPGNAFFLGTSQINFAPGQVRANNAILPLATDGAGTVRVINAAGTTHVLLDVSGYFE